jgi:hypothetical protein
MCNVTYCNEAKHTTDGYCIFHSYKSNNISYVTKHLYNMLLNFHKEKKKFDKIIIFVNMTQYIYYKHCLLFQKIKFKITYIDRLNYIYNHIKTNYNINTPIIKKFNIYYKKLCLILDIKNI